MPSTARLGIPVLALLVYASIACRPSSSPGPGLLTQSGGAGPLVIPMAIRVFDPAFLTEPDALAILEKSSVLLQTEDWVGDCACPVELRRDSFGTFEDPNNGVVSSKADFNALFADTFTNPSDAMTADPDLAPRIRQVRVVSHIEWCGGITPDAAGCADEPGLRIAITRRSALLEGELWAHETGHTRGLPHRNNSWTAVMHETVLPDHKELTVAECNKYRR